jgi:hypothetical protein
MGGDGSTERGLRTAANESHKLFTISLFIHNQRTNQGRIEWAFEAIIRDGLTVAFRGNFGADFEGDFAPVTHSGGQIIISGTHIPIPQARWTGQGRWPK